MSKGKHARPDGAEKKRGASKGAAGKQPKNEAAKRSGDAGQAQPETVVPSSLPSVSGRISPAVSGGMSPAVSNQTVPVNPVAPASGTVADAALPPGFAEAAAAELKRRRRKKVRKVLGIAAGIVVAVVLVVYVAGAVVFMNRFLPNTMMGDTDVSLASGEEVRAQLDERAGGYTLDVSGAGVNDALSLSLSSDQMGLSFDSESVVRSMLDAANPWLWPFELTRERDVSEAVVAGVEGTALAETVHAAVEAANVDATAPIDAAVSYDAEQDAFVVAAEQPGTLLNADAVVAEVVEAIAALEPSVALSADSLEKPARLSDDPELAAAAAAANELLVADSSLTMAGEVAAKIDADSISDWIVFDEDLAPSLSDEALSAWVAEVAESHTTAGGERTFTRPDGKEVTVTGGGYGWKVNHDELLALVRSIVENQEQGTTHELPCSQTADAWTGVGGRDWGRYVDVDLTEQYARFYDEEGSVIWESDIVTGKPSSPTTEGVWECLELDEYRTLRGPKQPDGSYEWESPVRYWMRITWSGIGFHDATWQYAFGGTRWKDGYGSHGCINLPYGKAEQLFGLIELGDVAVVHY